MKIGIFGGTFNPIHNGHIKVASKVLKLLNLDKVLFMPNKIPPHKDVNCIEDDKVRVEMIMLAIKSYDFFEIEEYELKKDKVSYTFDSLHYLDRIYKGSQLYFIIGSDSFINFDKWQKIDRIFRSATIVIYLRSNDNKERVFSNKHKYEELYRAKIEVFSDEIIEVSSTEIRDKILKNEDITNLISKDVREYIISKGLYEG